MKTLFLPGAAILCALLASPLVKAQSVGVGTTPLSNRDVVFMVRQKLDSAEIVRIIQASPCTFDIFPPVLRDLKRRGVPESVLAAMLEAPYGPSVERSGTKDLDEAPIYHYAEQLKQMGYLVPSSGHGLRPTRQRARASRSRQRL